MWYVYILKCKDSSLYTGSTTDITRRLKQHNAGKGGYYTKIHYPVKLLYKEPHPTRSSAQKREAQIKHWTKAKKLSLISHNKALLRQLAKSRDYISPPHLFRSESRFSKRTVVNGYFAGLESSNRAYGAFPDFAFGANSLVYFSNSAIINTCIVYTAENYKNFF